MVKAITLYEAAAAGLAAAEHSLGNIYEKGLGGLEVDEERALDFYRSSAKNGYILSVTSIGNFYRYGLGGLEVDAALAYEYFLEQRKLVNL